MKKLIIAFLMLLSIQGIAQDYIQNQDKIYELSLSSVISSSLKGIGNLDSLNYLPDTKGGTLTSSMINVDKSYLQLRREYQAFCDEIVIDTLIEQGFITYTIKLINGKLENHITDTTWYEKRCDEYKYYPNQDGWVQGISFNAGTQTTITFDDINSTMTIRPVNPSTIEISREKYCKCKRQPASESNFFEWVAKNYLK